MKLYGTKTSPYVRRIRILAAELGVPYDWVDTSTEEGQASLRRCSPLWKIPVLEHGGDAVFDSRVIARVLLQNPGAGSLRPWNQPSVLEENLVTVIDGALDSLINVMYLGRDGIGSDRAAYLTKQRDRAAAAMQWVESHLHGASLLPDGGFGLPEIALISTLDWMRFRDIYDVSVHPGLEAFSEAHAARPSVADTAP